MANRNRDRGDYFERRTRDALEADGWVVVRSAGSLGPADLVALKPAHTPRLVSCKVGGRTSRAERRVLLETGHKAGAACILAWRESPGWVGMLLLANSGDVALPSIRMPVSHSTIRRRAIRDGLWPPGQQLVIPMGNADESETETD